MTVVQNAAGIGVPRFGFVGSLGEDSRPPGDINDEHGNLRSGDRPPVVDRLLLQIPRQYTAEEYEAMSPISEAIAEKTSSGVFVVGEVPPETRDLLDGMYKLTGAVVKRNDLADGLHGDYGVIVRQGSYQGKVVTFVESYYGHKKSLAAEAPWLLLLSMRIPEIGYYLNRPNGPPMPLMRLEAICQTPILTMHKKRPDIMSGHFLFMRIVYSTVTSVRRTVWPVKRRTLRVL